jgi:hypothetical protein
LACLGLRSESRSSFRLVQFLRLLAGRYRGIHSPENMDVIFRFTCL